MTIDPNTLTVENNTATGQYEVHVEGKLAFLEYRIRDDIITFTHTEVPPELEGRGIAARMARRALEDARAGGYTIIPFCPYVARYISRHPEYADMVHAGYRSLVTDAA
jgi:predicted GNAT family acetyltransferase